MEDFSRLHVKDYKYWNVSVYSNQSYLGRCVIWCIREDAIDLPDATKEEQEELFVILKDLREACKNIFAPDWFNYSFLGNGTRHLHAHFVPRYMKEKEFEGVTFTDKLWGTNFKTDNEFVTSEEILQKVRLKLKESLEG
tara:strand:+ start:2818 stop:3234 length:417 start_codon:yes stop_codon:yes gene_type:complete